MPYISIRKWVLITTTMPFLLLVIGYGYDTVMGRTFHPKWFFIVLMTAFFSVLYRPTQWRTGKPRQ